MNASVMAGAGRAPSPGGSGMLGPQGRAGRIPHGPLCGCRDDPPAQRPGQGSDSQRRRSGNPRFLEHCGLPGGAILEHPSLFGGNAGRGLARLVNHWSDNALGVAIRRLIAADFVVCLAPEDRDYYRRSREAAFGCTLEAYCAQRKHWTAEFNTVTAPLEQTLQEQLYFGGAAPTYADYILFSAFQYARLGCPDEFLAEGSALRRWRDGLVSAFGELGSRYPSHPASAG